LPSEERAFRLTEGIIIALLVIACGLFALRAPAALPLHLALLAGFVIAMRVRVLRAVAVVAVLMTLYSTLAEPAFVAAGGSRDALLASVDRALFLGRDPALLVVPAHLELFSFVYAIFIPYLWLSILLGCVGRPDAERGRFILGLTVTYAIAYLGYLFVPARGPVEWYHFAAPLQGGRFHDLVLKSVESTGGNHGAFPSLHVGASAYLCLFDLRTNLVRGMTYVPVVLAISVATIVLRYHYVVDILCGLALAAVAAMLVRSKA
jgi:membrane-associated phospholipid phosphatase